MSAKDVAAVLNHSHHSGTSKLVLLGIAWHTADVSGEGAYPSVTRLAMYAGVSVRQTIRALAVLEESGELDVDRHSGKSYGGPKTNRYWINVPCPSDCDGSTWHRPLDEIVPKFRVVDNSDTRDIQGISR